MDRAKDKKKPSLSDVLAYQFGDQVVPPSGTVSEEDRTAEVEKAAKKRALERLMAGNFKK